MPKSHITTKGQITLPKAIREHLKVKSGDAILFTVDSDGQVTVAAVNAPITSLKGIVSAPSTAPVTLEAMDQAIKSRRRAR